MDMGVCNSECDESTDIYSCWLNLCSGQGGLRMLDVVSNDFEAYVHSVDETIRWSVSAQKLRQHFEKWKLLE